MVAAPQDTRRLHNTKLDALRWAVATCSLLLMTSVGGTTSAIAQDASAVPLPAKRSDAIAERRMRAIQNSCSGDFAQRLADRGPSLVGDLHTALTTARDPVADARGRWLFTQARPVRRRQRRARDGSNLVILNGRVCTNLITSRGGRQRCRKWEPATPERIAALTQFAPPPDPRPTRNMRADLRRLTDFVRKRGALSSFREGGQFFFLSQRVVDELSAYLRQTPTARMCTGVDVMLTFYRGRLGLMRERIARPKTVQSRAERRIAALLTTITDQREAQRTPVSTGAENQADPVPATGATLPAVKTAVTPTEREPLPRTPDATASVGEIAAYVVAFALGEDDNATAPFIERDRVDAPLSWARAMLDREPPSGAFDDTAVAKRALAIRVLRAVELREAAKAEREKFEAFVTAVNRAIDEVGEMQAAHCRC